HVGWVWRPAGMVRAISEDLRSRVIAAVESGLSRRAAADRFGVAAASAVRWVREWRESGATRAKPQGGDKRSQRIEAYRDTILAAIEGQDDITLVELAEFSGRSMRSCSRRARSGAFSTVTR
ncbi:helix-turn-helix domain-containing protein, partial [Mesorhizobium sp. M0047]|uniref:helix-turn-helix domain-containing protein n=1 Tax=Mesorhizobium sp. M0047 TaxID=2956859 RepID=UPI0033386594